MQKKSVGRFIGIHLRNKHIHRLVSARRPGFLRHQDIRLAAHLPNLSLSPELCARSFYYGGVLRSRGYDGPGTKRTHVDPLTQSPPERGSSLCTIGLEPMDEDREAGYPVHPEFAFDYMIIMQVAD